jgi:hypothetical protein
MPASERFLISNHFLYHTLAPAYGHILVLLRRYVTEALQLFARSSASHSARTSPILVILLRIGFESRGLSSSSCFSDFSARST